MKFEKRLRALEAQLISDPVILYFEDGRTREICGPGDRGGYSLDSAPIFKLRSSQNPGSYLSPTLRGQGPSAVRSPPRKFPSTGTQSTSQEALVQRQLEFEGIENGGARPGAEAWSARVCPVHRPRASDPGDSGKDGRIGRHHELRKFYAIDADVRCPICGCPSWHPNGDRPGRIGDL
jgi:hypothetical protein